jgi:hypothetical protein
MRLDRLRARAESAWRHANRRWAPWLSLAAGITTALLWRQGIDVVRASLALGSTAGLVAAVSLFPPGAPRIPSALEAPWQRRLRAAAGFLGVGLAQNALWFVIPFYVLATTWPSRNAPFTALLAGLTVLSCFEPLFRRSVLEHRLRAAAFVALTQLAALQLLLPVLTGIPPRQVVGAAGALAALSAMPLALPRSLRGLRAGAATAAAALVGAGLAWLLLPCLAPAPLRLRGVSFALGHEDLDPREPLSRVPAAGGPVYVFAAVEAPQGVHERVRLALRSGSRALTSRALEIEGGRSGGYRLWAELAAEPGRPLLAQLRTEGDQLVGDAILDPEPARETPPDTPESRP